MSPINELNDSPNGFDKCDEEFDRIFGPFVKVMFGLGHSRPHPAATFDGQIQNGALNPLPQGSTSAQSASDGWDHRNAPDIRGVTEPPFCDPGKWSNDDQLTRQAPHTFSVPSFQAEILCQPVPGRVVPLFKWIACGAALCI